jgi:hypothetical protein
MNRTNWKVGMLLLLVVAGISIVAVAADVVINEIAWGGTSAGSQDEWIELHNVTDVDVDLTGWALQIGETRIPLSIVEDGTLEVRRTLIEANGYFLLERTDDDTVSDVAADVLYKGNLSNGGADVRLLDAAGEVVDEVVCSDDGWPAGCGGDGEIPYASMEREDPLSDVALWASWDGTTVCGLDAAGEPLHGTPHEVNAATIAYRSAPRVDLLSPTGGEIASPILVRWSASDPDGEATALRIRIDVSVGDEDWSVVAENLANAGSYLWDAAAYAGEEDVVIRVTAQDATGLSGDAESAPLAVVE